MDAPESPAPAVAATFAQKTWLRRLLSRIRPSWGSPKDRNTPSSYQVVMPDATSSGRDCRSPTPAAVEEEEPPERPAQKMPEPVSTPSCEADDPEDPPATTVLTSQAYVERLQRIACHYNLPMPSNYITYSEPEKERPRVHRPIRMRIHRSCHRCNTMFAGARVCVNCQHRACSLCQSMPRQRSLDPWNPSSSDPFAEDVEGDDYQGMQQQIVMARANRISTQPLVRKELKQRVRRTCHSCSTLFTSRNKICTNCHHVCCEQCPRSPRKRKKRQEDSTKHADEPASSSTAPIKYACHQCHRNYPPVPHPDSPEGLALGDAGLLDCSRCGHTRCPLCRRATPRSAMLPSAPPGPDVVRSVEAKLAAIQL